MKQPREQYKTLEADNRENNREFHSNNPIWKGFLDKKNLAVMKITSFS